MTGIYGVMAAPEESKLDDRSLARFQCEHRHKPRRLVQNTEVVIDLPLPVVFLS